MSTISFKTFSGSLFKVLQWYFKVFFKIILAKAFFLSNYKMPFLEIEKEIPMNPRQMHFINVLVVAYGRIDGQQSNKNSQLWFYKMLLFFECWKIPSNQPAKAFYKYQSRCYRARGLGPQNGEVQGENNKGEQLNGRTKMGKWYKMRNVTLMVSKHEKNCLWKILKL